MKTHQIMKTLTGIPRKTMEILERIVKKYSVMNRLAPMLMMTVIRRRRGGGGGWKKQ